MGMGGGLVFYGSTPRV